MPDDNKELLNLLSTMKTQRLNDMINAIEHRHLIENVIKGMSTTQDRGLAIVRYAVGIFSKNCQSSLGKASALRINKEDLGPDKSFWKLPAVKECKLENTLDLRLENDDHSILPDDPSPDGVWCFSVTSGEVNEKRALMVQIDKDDTDLKDSKRIAKTICQNMMYSKLSNGGTTSGILINGFSMRINMSGTAICGAQEEQTFKDMKAPKNGGKDIWLQNNKAKWQGMCLDRMVSLIGSLVFCMRDVVLSMCKTGKLYDSHKNKYHVNMFVGPYIINMSDHVVSTNHVQFAVTQDEKDCIDYHERKPIYYWEQTILQPYDNKWQKNLKWYMDVKTECHTTCLACEVKYLLIENFHNSMAFPKLIKAPSRMALSKILGDKPPDMYESDPVKNDISKHKNHGLMCLSDIISTSEMFHMLGPDTPIPDWQLVNLSDSPESQVEDFWSTIEIGSDQEQFEKFSFILKSVHNLMQNFIIFQINQKIDLAKKAWPLDAWMDNMAICLEQPSSFQIQNGRVSMPMTVNKSDDNPQSLGARLRSSLRVSLPELDPTVREFIDTGGFNNIRDGEFYLRMVGITNILALEQLALTHDDLLTNDEFHSRIFKSLSLGSQSEIRVMLQRISAKPSITNDVMKLLEYDQKSQNMKFPIPGVNNNSHKDSYKFINRIFEKHMTDDKLSLSTSKSPIDTEDENDFKSREPRGYKMKEFLLEHSDYIVKNGISRLASNNPLQDKNIFSIDLMHQIVSLFDSYVQMKHKNGLQYIQSLERDTSNLQIIEDPNESAKFQAKIAARLQDAELDSAFKFELGLQRLYVLIFLMYTGDNARSNECSSGAFEELEEVITNMHANLKKYKLEQRKKQAIFVTFPDFPMQDAVDGDDELLWSQDERDHFKSIEMNAVEIFFKKAMFFYFAALRDDKSEYFDMEKCKVFQKISQDACIFFQDSASIYNDWNREVILQSTYKESGAWIPFTLYWEWRQSEV